ncbi:MAG: biopolymer transporter ExbD [Cryobacterium sp.]|nr:biopolymer transporter ExbD [Oligoflexia bacterium]
MLKKTFLPTQVKNEQMALQITSMADIFVIILVFLLKSYSVEGLAYEPSVPLTPPMAHGRIDQTDGLKVEISAKAVNLAGKSVSPVSDFRFAKGDMDSNGASQSLRRALAKTRPSVVSGPKGAKLIVVADAGAPYETIKAVLSSAASEGYNDIQLAVAHAE